MVPVVLLHPLGSDRRFWDTVPLPGVESVVALDLPGHGSAPLPDVADGVAGLAAHVLDALADLGVDEFDVVGVSLGGLVAQHLLAHAPERVRRGILVDTVVTYPEAMLAMWSDRAATARRDGMGPIVEPTLAIWFTDEARESHADLVAEVSATVLATDPEGYARTCAILAGADLTAELDLMTRPVLSVCGEQDGAPFQAAARQIAEATAGTPQWLPGKHAAVLESPDVFARLLTGFLADEPAPTQTGVAR